MDRGTKKEAKKMLIHVCDATGQEELYNKEGSCQNCGRVHPRLKERFSIGNQVRFIGFQGGNELTTAKPRSGLIVKGIQRVINDVAPHIRVYAIGKFPEWVEGCQDYFEFEIERD